MYVKVIWMTILIVLLFTTEKLSAYSTFYRNREIQVTTTPPLQTRKVWQGSENTAHSTVLKTVLPFPDGLMREIFQVDEERTPPLPHKKPNNGNFNQDNIRDESDRGRNVNYDHYSSHQEFSSSGHSYNHQVNFYGNGVHMHQHPPYHYYYPHYSHTHNKNPYYHPHSHFQPYSNIDRMDTNVGETSGSSGIVFKVQRNPEGNLNVVFNDTVIASRNSPESPIGSSHNRRSSPPQRMDQGDIIFPDDHDFKKVVRPIECAKKGELFCEEVQNYPSAHVQAILRSELDKYEQLFGEDLVPTAAPNITQRIDTPGEESLCPSVEKLIFPQAGLTKDNNWSFIVNQENFTQGIRVEECLNAGKPCAMTDGFPNGYTTECKQGYIYRQLLSLNADGRVVKDLFRLPSCCKCVIKSTHRFRRNTSQDNYSKD